MADQLGTANAQNRANGWLVAYVVAGIVVVGATAVGIYQVLKRRGVIGAPPTAPPGTQVPPGGGPPIHPPPPPGTQPPAVPPPQQLPGQPVILASFVRTVSGQVTGTAGETRRLGPLTLRLQNAGTAPATVTVSIAIQGPVPGRWFTAYGLPPGSGGVPQVSLILQPGQVVDIDWYTNWYFELGQEGTYTSVATVTVDGTTRTVVDGTFTLTVQTMPRYTFSSCPLLGTGSSGPVVQAVQQSLKFLGFDPGPIDGIFGPRTRDAVMSFQQASGIAVDGVVGRQTYTALDLALRARGGYFVCQTLP